MTIREIDAYMSNWAKPSYSASWDNDGIMLCLDRDREITRVTVALEINADVIAAAVKNGADYYTPSFHFLSDQAHRRSAGVGGRISSRPFEIRHFGAVVSHAS